MVIACWPVWYTDERQWNAWMTDTLSCESSVLLTRIPNGASVDINDMIYISYKFNSWRDKLSQHPCVHKKLFHSIGWQLNNKPLKVIQLQWFNSLKFRYSYGSLYLKVEGVSYFIITDTTWYDSFQGQTFFKRKQFNGRRCCKWKIKKWMPFKW